jgi:hypothetical protein
MQAFGCNQIMTNVNPLQAEEIQTKNHHHESPKSGKHPPSSFVFSSFRAFVIGFQIRPLII